MKQTAVEWLELNLLGLISFDSEELRAKYKDRVAKAKEMEKQQSYNEEEVIKLLQKALTHKDNGETGSLVTAQGQIRTANFYSWFEQFKKK